MFHRLLHDRLSSALAGVAAAVVAAALALPPASARADDAQVTVVSPGGNARTLSLAALAGSEDVVDHAYALRTAAGPGELSVTGFSLAAIVDAAGADPYAFSYAEVQRPAGGSVLLSREQALDLGAFGDGPAVVYATEAGTGFLRPQTSGEDLNADDSFEAPQGVTLVLRKGKPLRVEIETSTRRTRPGEKISFEAVVKRAGAGEPLTYSWYFDDGGSASGPSAAHSFAKRGSYDVVLGVTTPGDEAGTSAVVTIQVGPPLSGPDRKGGGVLHDETAPDHGAAAGTSGFGVAPTDTQRGRRPRVRRGNADTARHENAAGERVAGELVSATVPVEAAKPLAARSGQLESNGEGGGIPETALGVLITAGLLGAGALFETRSLRR